MEHKITAPMMDPALLLRAIEECEIPNHGSVAAHTYSGQGMNGKQCVGVTLPTGVSSASFASAVAASLVNHVMTCGPDDDAKRFSAVTYAINDFASLRVCDDFKGHFHIVYFPDVKFSESEKAKVALRRGA